MRPARANHKTISTGPWKSRTEREILTFPQADSLWFTEKAKEKERKMNRPQSGSLFERCTGLLSERRLQHRLRPFFVLLPRLQRARTSSWLKPRSLFSKTTRLFVVVNPQRWLST